jgi:protein translocase SecG subunit
VYILFWIVVLLFIALSALIVAIILLQEPKQSGLGEGMGGGQDFSNVRGTAGGLHRLTIYLGVIWGLLALALSVLPRA